MSKQDRLMELEAQIAALKYQMGFAPTTDEIIKMEKLRSQVARLRKGEITRGSTKKTNREGLTWEEWRDAARVAAPRTGLSPGLIKEWRKEWKKGTDPTEMRDEDY